MTIFFDTFLADLPVGKISSTGLTAHLRDLIASGKLAEDTKLPPVRDVAWHLKCAVGTVSRTYRALAAEGLVHGEVGRGTFVGGKGVAALMPHSAAREAGMVDLGVNCFLMEPAGEMMQDAFQEVGQDLLSNKIHLDYVGESGALEDRVAAMEYLARWRDDLSPEGICVVGGSQSAFSAAFASLVRPDTGIACDALTYPGVITAANLHGRRLIGIAMDQDGMVPEALEAACRRNAISLLVLMPDLHNPTGRTMPLKRREALADVAARHDLTIFEDQVYGFLNEHHISSFSQLMPERTLLVSSLSKSVAPALRVGYAAGPVRLVRRVTLAHNAMSMMGSTLTAAVASYLIRSGRLDARILRLRAGVRHRVALVREIFPELEEETLGAGLAWLKLPKPWRSRAFCAEAEVLGIRLADGRLFAADPASAPEAVRISFCASPDEIGLRKALVSLSELIRSGYPGGVAEP